MYCVRDELIFLLKSVIEKNVQFELEEVCIIEDGPLRCTLNCPWKALVILWERERERERERLWSKKRNVYCVFQCNIITISYTTELIFIH